jgi:DNA-binding GntR family transcriptional regulator
VSVGCDCGDHEELLDLLKQGDRARARQWMADHLGHIEASLDFASAEEEAPDFRRIFGLGKS